MRTNYVHTDPGKSRDGGSRDEIDLKWSHPEVSSRSLIWDPTLVFYVFYVSNVAYMNQVTKPSFNDINLLRSMLADCHLPRRREWGAIAAAGWRRPPWSGCIFLPSFHLANCMSGVRRPQNQQKPNHCPTKYLHQYLAKWDVWSTHPMRIHGRKKPVSYGYAALSSWGQQH